MRRSVEHKAQTRRRILAEAVRSVREGGARSIHVAQIMQDAGLTHGGFYAHFPSREALISEAVAQTSAESEGLNRLSRHPFLPAKAVADFLEHYLSIGNCERQPGACPLPILLPELEELTPEARATTRRLVSRLSESLGNILADLGRSSPGEDATRLLAEAVGLITLARALPKRSMRSALLARARKGLLAAYGAIPEPSSPDGAVASPQHQNPAKRRNG